MTDAPPPPEAPAPPPASPPPGAPSARSLPLPLPAILIIAAILVIGVVAFVATHTSSSSPTQAAYTVQPYTPPSELITASDRVIAHAAPDAASPAVVMFGQGVTLAVNGRVSRGLGSDWYAIAWNGHPAFVRQQDAVEGHGAPPVAAEHPAQTEDIRKPEDDDVKPDEEEEVVTPDEPDSSLGMDLSNVDWIRPPNARDFARFYPHRALDQGRSGRVVLDCVAQPNGMLDCSVASENPPGNGFGQAALSISRQVRIQPTMPDGRSVAGGHLRLPLTFRAD